MTAKERWQQWSARFAALSAREKAMVAAAALFAVGFLGYNFGVEPALLRNRAAQKTLQRVQAEMAPLPAQLAAIAAQNADPDAVNRTRLEQVRRQLAAANDRLAAFEAGMVPPEKMGGFLENLLRRNRNLELLGLKTLPVTAVGAAAPAAPAAPAAGTGMAAAKAPAAADAGEGMFQHGVEIRVAGSYNDLLGYLADLERMPQRLMWSSATLAVEKYPRNVLTLRIYTLSLDRKWLVV
jgi:MSHA biogenesis protein MshJ